MEKFVHFREVLTPSGVYCLLHAGEVVYVGKSRNVYMRLSNHYTNLMRVRKGKPPYHNKHVAQVIAFDDAWVKFCPRDVLDAEEAKLIQQHLPKYNTHHVVPRYDLRNVPAFQELLKRARSRGVPNYLRRGF